MSPRKKERYSHHITDGKNKIQWTYMTCRGWRGGPWWISDWAPDKLILVLFLSTVFHIGLFKVYLLEVGLTEV